VADCLPCSCRFPTDSLRCPVHSPPLSLGLGGLPAAGRTRCYTRLTPILPHLLHAHICLTRNLTHAPAHDAVNAVLRAKKTTAPAVPSDVSSFSCARTSCRVLRLPPNDVGGFRTKLLDANLVCACDVCALYLVVVCLFTWFLRTGLPTTARHYAPATTVRRYAPVIYRGIPRALQHTGTRARWHAPRAAEHFGFGFGRVVTARRLTGAFWHAHTPTPTGWAAGRRHHSERLWFSFNRAYRFAPVVIDGILGRIPSYHSTMLIGDRISPPTRTDKFA